MQKIKIKYKFLLSGYPYVDSNYKMDDLVFKKVSSFNELIDSENMDDVDFSDILDLGVLEKINRDKLNVISKKIKGLKRPLEKVLDKVNFDEIKQSVSYKDENDKLFFCTLESKKYVEYEIANHYSFKSKKIGELLKRYPEMKQYIFDIINRIKLEVNVSVNFPISFLEFFDSNNELIKVFIIINNFLDYNKIFVIDKKEFENNVNFISSKRINHFSNIPAVMRSLSFFYDSFNSYSIEIRYMMLITCLECLFNLDENDVVDRFSEYTSKIVSKVNNEWNYEFMKKLYKKRCKYVHGSICKINENDELILRRIVRIVLIFVLQIKLDKGNGIKSIIKYVDDDSNFTDNDLLLLKELSF